MQQALAICAQQLAVSCHPQINKSAHKKEAVWREARFLLQAALNLSPLDLHTKAQHPLSTFPEHPRLGLWLEKRALGMPLSRLKGQRDFWKHTFELSPSTLDPRPETELLITYGCQFFKNKRAPQRILELGVGTGCLLLSLLHEFPHATGVGTDLCPKALATAKHNAKKLNMAKRVTWWHGDWFNALPQHCPHFDLIVSNPPYIPTNDITLLSKEVTAFDPKRALDGGQDGLDAYRILYRHAPSYLTQTPHLFMCEIGTTQQKTVTSLAKKAFAHVTTHCDLAGHPRMVAAHQAASLPH